MSIKDQLRSAINSFLAVEKSTEQDEQVFANGTSITDKKDVEDPTGKFAGIRHIRTARKNRRLRNNVDFFKPEYDLPTIANAVQLDGILRRTVSLFTEQIMKNGFEHVSPDEKIQKHVNRRIREIERLTGISLYETLTNVANQLVTYGNAYLLKVRSSMKSNYGKPYRLYGKDLNPIVGLFVLEATTMEIGLGPKGNVIQYKQTIRGEEQYWDERDIIHLPFNKIPGTLTGMASMLPILDDVRALRKLEEEIEILGFQYSIPLYLYKVGNKDVPAAPGEVDEVSSTINSMPAYGMLVVPGNHTIEVPSNNNTPVDIMSFVDHFKKRIYAGLGVSPVAMGEVGTSNRNTSEVLDASMQTVTKSYQQIIKYKLEMQLFSELLLDGNYNSLDNIVEFNFPEIDLEQQIKFETNIIQKWQNNLIDIDEARNEMDLEKKMNEKRTFLELVELPKLREQGALDLATAKAKSSIDNKVRPANQQGKSTGRPKIVKNTINDLRRNLNVLINNSIDIEGISDFNSNTIVENATKDITFKLKQQISDVIRIYTEYYNLPKITIDNKLVDIYVNSVENILKNKISFFAKKVTDEYSGKILNDEINDFISKQSDKIENIAKILMYKSLGFKTILIDADDCKEHEIRNIDVIGLNYSHIPPIGYNCNCEVNEESFHEFK